MMCSSTKVRGPMDSAPAMRALNYEQRESLRKALDARADALRERISEALDQRGDGLRALANHSEETDDDAVVDLQTSIDATMLERDVFELRAAMRALVRLYTHEFGKCAGCGEIIPFARLQANPLATRCSGCQTAHERTHATKPHPTL